MEKDSILQILSLSTVDSTQLYLKKLLSSKKVTSPYAVVSSMQTDGIGSRENSWEGMKDNLFLSFSLPLNSLPEDLKIESASIYFAYILKETLQEFSSNVWLKWPNDFYIENKKIGGMITNVVDKNIICGVGLNLKKAPDGFSVLDIKLERDALLEKYFENIEKKFLWKQVFSKYKLEFYRNQNFFTYKNSLRISLDSATLQSDGSIINNGERIYSLR